VFVKHVVLIKTQFVLYSKCSNMALKIDFVYKLVVGNVKKMLT